MSYQMMFAVITPALITGAIADRMRFGAWAWFVGIWVMLVYAPVAHWVFAPAGWLARRGALDFAGGTVVHINAGIAALAVVLVIGRRRGWPRTPMPPHSLPLTLIGTGILWFGWFGFNAGSALRADGLAVQALVNTHLARRGGDARLGPGRALARGPARRSSARRRVRWRASSRSRRARDTSAGCRRSRSVAITGAICYAAVNLKFKLRFDDALDVVGVHLVGGIVGSLLLGLLRRQGGERARAATECSFTAAGSDCWASRSLAVVRHARVLVRRDASRSRGSSTRLFPGGLRVDEEAEDTGLDLREHSEVAYSFAER